MKLSRYQIFSGDPTLKRPKEMLENEIDSQKGIVKTWKGRNRQIEVQHQNTPKGEDMKS